MDTRGRETHNRTDKYEVVTVLLIINTWQQNNNIVFSFTETARVVHITRLKRRKWNGKERQWDKLLERTKKLNDERYKRAKKKCNSTELDISRWGHERIAEYTPEKMREKKVKSRRNIFCWRNGHNYILYIRTTWLSEEIRCSFRKKGGGGAWGNNLWVTWWPFLG